MCIYISIDQLKSKSFNKLSNKFNLNFFKPLFTFIFILSKLFYHSLLSQRLLDSMIFHSYVNIPVFYYVEEFSNV